MLDQNKIIEAQKNIHRYLTEGLLKKEVFQTAIYRTYIRNHEESLVLAEHILKNKLSNLWVIVISYYSMFYLTSAVLYKRGYKAGDKIVHKITADALIVYLRESLKNTLLEEYELAREEALEIAGNKADQIIDSFDLEREKRSIFQYTSTEEIKQAKAKTSFERAKIFANELRKLL